MNNQHIERLNNTLRSLGEKVITGFQRVGRCQIFLFDILTNLNSLKGVSKQIYSVGVLSLPIIVVAGFFVGMVLGLQGYYTLVNFGAADSIGVLVALSLTRELGPVVGAILFAGRSGSALTTEIGLMKTTEQLSALELMGIDPIRYIMRARFIAGIFCLPLLIMIFVAVGIFGSWFISVGTLGIDDGAFWSQMQSKVSWGEDIINGFIKSVVFALVVTWLALFLGNDSIPTAEGVSRATTQSVVYSSLSVLGLDFILTAIMF